MGGVYRRLARDPEGGFQAACLRRALVAGMQPVDLIRHDGLAILAEVRFDQWGHKTSRLKTAADC